MLLLSTSGWCRIGPILSLYIIVVFRVATLSVQSANLSTHFSFPVFPAADDFFSVGEFESRYNPDSLSFTTIPILPDSSTRFSCVKLCYKDKVLMKSRESNAVASFSTSFTFSITQRDESTNRSGWLSHSDGFGFFLISEYLMSSFIAGQAKASYSSVEYSAMKYFGIKFDTYNDYITEDPSDNYIGVNLNNVKSAHTHNLCEGHQSSCAFPWTGRTYTSWIDYNGSTGSLEVWFANGSLREGVMRPAGPGLIKVPELNLKDIIEDYMYIGFRSKIPPFSLDTHEVLSWNFVSTYPEAMPAPTPVRTRLFSKETLIICAACGTITLAGICFLGHWRIRQLYIDKSEPGLGLGVLSGLRRFSFKELREATKNFNKGALLGKGGSGSVYKGTLTSSGLVVAVKRLKHDSEHVQREFLAEVTSISQIRHRNLVLLQGWCHEDEHFCLVFDYMSNGSLDEWLFPSSRRHPSDSKYKRFEVLPWQMRFSILAGVAAAVEYLHEEWVQCVLHRDIKSSNVMLDADFNPHLGDFGLARLIDHEKVDRTTVMAGTFGYMAPEIYYTGKATKESDVYSFGILMLEVLCGRRAVNLQVEDPDENSMLVHNVWGAHEDGNILSAVDPGLTPSWSSTTSSNITTRLTTSSSEGVLVVEVVPNPSPLISTHATVGLGELRVVLLLHLGLQCCLLEPESRPSMRVVKQVIMQVQSSTAELDPVVAMKPLPPLPSTMPLLGDLLHRSSLRVPIASTAATKGALEEMEARGLPDISHHGGLRRRFVTN